MNETTLMPSPSTAKYYVGDLCYVMTNDEWEEVCDMIAPPFTGMGVPPSTDETEGKLQLADGRKFAIYSTAYGDGIYSDNYGRSYCVDSGTLGIIKVEDIRYPEFNEETILRMGQIVELPADFDSISSQSEDGQILFDTVAIETGDQDYDYEDEDGDYDYGYEDDDEDA
jgi:hypothetical protein